MRELDAVLLPFVERHLDGLSEEDKARFDALLNLSDPELYDYLLRRNEPEDRGLAELINRIRGSVGD